MNRNKPSEGAVLFAAAPDLSALRPISEVATAVEADLAEIEARNSGKTVLVVTALNETQIWANFRKNKGTPLSQHALK